MNNELEQQVLTLRTYPGKIETKVKDVLDKKNAIAQLKEVMKKCELRIEFDVLEDSVKENWKKELSNAEKRKKEVTSRLGRDETYVRTKDLLIEQKEDDIPYIEAEISRMRREFDAAKVLVPLLTGLQQ